MTTSNAPGEILEFSLERKFCSVPPMQIWNDLLPGEWKLYELDGQFLWTLSDENYNVVAYGGCLWRPEDENSYWIIPVKIETAVIKNVKIRDFYDALKLAIQTVKPRKVLYNVFFSVFGEEQQP